MTSFTLDLCLSPTRNAQFSGVLVEDARRFPDGLPAEAIALNAQGVAQGDRLALEVIDRRGEDMSAALAKAGGLFIVMANPLPGRHAEFERFYVERHMDDMLRLDGVLAALFCRNTGAGRTYVSLFPITDCDTVKAAIAAARGTPDFPPNPETDRDASRPGFYDRLNAGSPTA